MKNTVNAASRVVKILRPDPDDGTGCAHDQEVWFLVQAVLLPSLLVLYLVGIP
jgi:hypothetical protein